VDGIKVIVIADNGRYCNRCVEIMDTGISMYTIVNHTIHIIR